MLGYAANHQAWSLVMSAWLPIFFAESSAKRSFPVTWRKRDNQFQQSWNGTIHCQQSCTIIRHREEIYRYNTFWVRELFFLTGWLLGNFVRKLTGTNFPIRQLSNMKSYCKAVVIDSLSMPPSKSWISQDQLPVPLLEKKSNLSCLSSHSHRDEGEVQSSLRIIELPRIH